MLHALHYAACRVYNRYTVYIAIHRYTYTALYSVYTIHRYTLPLCQEPRHVALEASDQPILQPIVGIAKQAGFAERRYSDQLHGSDRDLRCAFVCPYIC